MDKRILGIETITFVDGTEKEFNIFAVASRKVAQIRKVCRVVKFNSKGNKVESAESNMDDVAFQIMKLSFGDQITVKELDEDVETDIEELYRKHFEKEVVGNDEKKGNTSE